MSPFRKRLLPGALLPVVIGVGAALVLADGGPAVEAEAQTSDQCVVPRLQDEAATEGAEVTPEELAEVYDCLTERMRTAYAQSGFPEATEYADWTNFAARPYISATHGDRYVLNYANDVAEGPYGEYKEMGEMPEGGILAKPSFTISAEGVANPGPLTLMEKMEPGFNEETDDWRYTAVTPAGGVVGRTGGQNSGAVQFCAGCHMAVAENQDSLFFLPEDVRAGQ